MTNSANEVTRTITSTVMNEVLKYVPKDGFKLTDKSLNKLYTVIGVDRFDIGTTKSFSVTMENEDGGIITISASALKRSRYLSKVVDTSDKSFDGTKNIFSRSNADAIWNGSTYLHAGLDMKKDEDFVIPEKLMLRYAILAEDANTNEPLLNPFLYKEFRKVVKVYDKNGTYPTMDDFREELLKTKEEGRLSFLPTSMLEPTPYAWVKREVSDFRHTLVFQAV